MATARSISAAVAWMSVGPRSPQDLDLVDGGAAQVEERCRDIAHLAAAVDRRARVVDEGVEQIAAAAAEQELADVDPLARLAQEGLLAGGADDVVVGVPVAHVLQRLEPAEPLVAGVDVDRGEARALGGTK